MPQTKAPSFKLTSHANKTVSLSDFAGKALVLYFYPRNDTPGCTREAIAFTKRAAELAKAGATVVGVSKDSIESHGRFRDKYALTIPLLSDPDLATHKAYGAYGEKVMYGKKVLGVIRSTFLIRDGLIVKAWKSVKVDGHDEQVLAALMGEAESTPKKKAAKKAPAKKAPAKKKAAKAKR